MEHSEKVAKRAMELLSDTRFKLDDLPFKAGLLHDLGKLNPFYQILFNAEDSQMDTIRDELAKTYLDKHSLLSAIFSYRLLRTLNIPQKELALLTSVILSHHSSLKQLNQGLYNPDDPYYEPFCKSRKAMQEHLKQLQPQLVQYGFKKADLDKAIRFMEIDPQENSYCATGNPFSEYIDFIALYSALLVADRGSFFEIDAPKFDLALNTDAMLKKTKLSELRENFQDFILKENHFDSRLMILKAPTGIGKTKIFLDILNKLNLSKKFERVFYFSPLLALTDDIETKLFKGYPKKGIAPIARGIDQNDVLIYNHLFQGTLKRKQERDKPAQSDLDDYDEFESIQSYKTKEWFEMESFNKKMIITTTQRLILTLYSNSAHDKLKLLSFKNSLLIIDEVQTLPKYMLNNLLNLLSELSEKLNCTVLFVSATVPPQIEEFKDVYMIKTPATIESEYLDATKKKINYMEKLDLNEISSLRDGPNLIMANTRKKAVDLFRSLQNPLTRLHYLSSGVVKEERKSIINNINPEDPSHNATTIVSTQVVEAGVDVSFKRMFREVAPLDNIVQAMGRLNRENESSDEPVLNIFEIDRIPCPYVELEVNESRAILQGVKTSSEIYGSLNTYYKKIQLKNQTDLNLSKNLDDLMQKLNFKKLFEFIDDNFFKESSKGIVYIPKLEHLETFTSKLINNHNSRQILKQYMDRTAELPVPLRQVEDMLNPTLLEREILVPTRKDYSTIYDAVLGLDVLLLH